MKRTVKVIGWGVLLAVFGFSALLIAFGGGRRLSLEKAISSAPTLIPQDISSVNFTNEFTDKLAADIIEKNPGGPAASESIVSPSPKQFAVETIEEQLKNFNPQTLIPVILDSDIAVVSPTTYTNTAAYFKNYFSILNARLSKVSINQAAPELTDFAGISKSYKQAMAELAAVKTPNALLDIQIHSLELLGAQANIFELYSRQAEDPLKALLAAQLQKQISLEAGELQKTVLLYIQDNRISW